MTANSRGPLHRIGRFAPVVAAVVAAALLVLVVTRSDDDDSDAAPASTSSSTSTTEATTTTTTAPPDPVSPETISATPFPEAAPASYRITYDIVENQLARTETLTVRRPFESLVISERDGAQIGGTATSRSRLWTYLTDREGWLVLQPELHRAAFDARPLGAMAAAIALGRAEEIGTDSYIGTTCRRFRTGQPLGSSGITAPTEEESTDLCIDDRGLVLHERWQIGGTPVIERTATSVETDVVVDAAIFDPTPVIEDAEEFEAILSAIAVPADEETLAQLQTDIAPPEGFVLEGSVLRAGNPRQSGSTPTSTEIVRFYSDGRHLVEVAEFVSTSPVVLDTGNAVPIDIDGPETWFSPDFRASAVRTRLSDNSYVEIRGTDPALLMALLDSLTRRPG